MQPLPSLAIEGCPVLRQMMRKVHLIGSVHVHPVNLPVTIPVALKHNSPPGRRGSGGRSEGWGRGSCGSGSGSGSRRGCRRGRGCRCRGSCGRGCRSRCRGWQRGRDRGRRRSRRSGWGGSGGSSWGDSRFRRAGLASVGYVHPDVAVAAHQYAPAGAFNFVGACYLESRPCRGHFDFKADPHVFRISSVPPRKVMNRYCAQEGRGIRQRSRGLACRLGTTGNGGRLSGWGWESGLRWE